MPHRGPPSRGTPGHTNPFTTNFEASAEEQDKDKSKEKDSEKDEMRDNNDNGEGPSGHSGSDNEGRAGEQDHHGRYCGGRRRRGPCGPDGPGGWGAPWSHGGPHHGSRHHGRDEHRAPNERRGFNEHRGHCHRGPGGPHGPHRSPGGHNQRGGWGPWGRSGLFDNAGFDPANLATHFWNQFTDTNNSTGAATKENEDLTPDADVFDTESAYVVHISLPGAKKEDVGVNWDAEKSELSVAGVIYRPGDEEFLKTLAMNERKVGPFERKLRLGTRASPAHIDADGITARLEDGILRVEVPKLDSGYVEIRKVDIE
jgi:HSP20 family protein